MGWGVVEGVGGGEERREDLGGLLFKFGARGLLFIKGRGSRVSEVEGIGAFYLRPLTPQPLVTQPKNREKAKGFTVHNTNKTAIVRRELPPRLGSM